MTEKQDFSELLKTLSTEQLRFVGKRVDCHSDKEAAAALGIPVDTVYGWPNKADVNEAVKRSHLDGIELGHERLRRMIQKALDVVDSEMESSDPDSHRYNSALEVLDRVGLSAIKQQRIEGPGEGGAIVFQFTDNLDV